MEINTDENKNKLGLGNFFFTRGVKVASIIPALFGGVTAGLLFGNAWVGVITACITILALALILPFVFYFIDLPYVKYVNTLQDKIMLAVRVQIGKYDGGLAVGVFALAKDKLYLMTRHSGGHEIIVMRDDVNLVQMTKDFDALQIEMKDDNQIKIVSGENLTLYRALEQNGWNVKPIFDGEEES